MRLKRSMSNFDIAVLLGEIGQSVKEAWINNIYQIGEIFLLKLNTRTGEKTLLVELGRRIHLTKYQRNAPKTPTNFSMALRKHIRNGQIQDVVQHDLDRIVTIRIRAHSEEYALVLELFGDGNLILCNSRNEIIMGKHYKVMRDRSLKPKEVFTMPPPRGVDLMSLSEEEITSILASSSSSLVETLGSKLNIDPLYAEEICKVSNIEKSKKAKQLLSDERSKILEATQLLITRIKNGPYEPEIVYDESNNPIHVTPLHLRSFDNLPTKRMSSFNDALDEFFGGSESRAASSVETERRKEKIQEIEKTLDEQRRKIAESKELAAKNRRLGEIIYSHLPQVEEILSTLKLAREKGVGWQDLQRAIKDKKTEGTVVDKMIRALDPAKGIAEVTLEGENVTIDIRQSATQNASNFYELAKRAEMKRKGAEAALQTVLQKLQAQTEENKTATRETLRKKRIKKWYEKYRWFMSSDGFLVIGGRDSKTNEIVVKKRLEPNDIFVHADVHGAPVTVIKTEGKDVPYTTLVEACQFSISYSRLWKAGVSSGDAYWAKGEQVSLTPPSGEYLQKGSFMVRGDRTYVKGVPVKIAVGLVADEEGNIIPIAGPPSSIEKRTRALIRISPGAEPSSKVAQQTKSKLSRLVSPELRAGAERIAIDDFLLLLPAGGSQIEA